MTDTAADHDMAQTPAESLEQARRIATEALRLWDLPVTGLEALKVRENAVFRVDLAGGRRAVVRVHRAGYHSNSSLASEFAWMRALGEVGIQVPRPIPSRLGRDFECVAMPGDPVTRQVDILEWIDGQQLGSVTNIDGDDATIVERYRMIGGVMARLHDQAAAWTLPAGFSRHAWDLDGLMGENPLWGRFWELAALRPSERQLMERTRASVSRALGALPRSADGYGLIHADLVPENILVNGGDLRVIDFDDAGFGWHWFDVATSLYFITAETFYPRAREALLAGYQSVRRLPGSAEEQLPLFMAARSTTYLGWVHTRQGTETALELSPFLIERACAVCSDYLAVRRD